MDGAPWIRNRIRGQSLPVDAVGVDLYHLANPGAPGLHYVAERRDMIRYPEFLEKGWQIGSPGAPGKRCARPPRRD